MAWPTPQEYNEAIQNPRTAFSDPELRAGLPVLTPLGLPRPITGAFASVYQLNCANGRNYAVRCFLREFGDQQERYAAISAHLLAHNNLPYMANFTYLADGIRVGGRWYPILKMEWLAGDSLTTYIERNLRDPLTLLTLAEQWVQMSRALRGVNIGHGDLQHGNVIVVDGQLRLIDYDGMFVPALAGRQSHEVGHRNYQHPQRTEREFDPAVDNFSTWVVYTSLVALSVEPSLWRTAGGGDECLILRREDFDRPAASKVLRTLTTASDARLRNLGAAFQTLCLVPIHQVPPIDGMLPEPPAAGTMPAAATVAGGMRTPAGPGRADWLRDHVRPAARPAPAVAAPAPVAAGTMVAPPGAAPSAPSASSASSVTATVPHNGTGPATAPTAEAPTTGETQPVKAEEPSWIVDFLGPQQLTQAEFGDLARPRTAIVLAAIVTIVAWLGVTAAGATFAIPAGVTAVALLGSLAAVANSYWNDPSVAAQRVEQRSGTAINRKLRLAQRDLGRVARRQVRVEHTFTRRRFKLEQREQRSQAQEKEALQRADARLKQDLALAQHRRDQLQQQGDAAVRRLEAQHAQRLAALDRQLGELRTQEQQELANTLRQRQAKFVRDSLKRQTLAAANIDGIGPAVKEKLRTHGIVYAADVERARLAPVYGVGDKRTADLLRWRQDLEALALKLGPQSLNQLEEGMIRLRYIGRNNNVGNQKRRTQAELAKQVAEAKTRTTAQLQATTDEPAKLRERHDRRKDELRKQYREQRVLLKQQIAAVDAELATARRELDVQAVPIQAEVARLTAQRASLDWRLRRYASIDLSHYLRRVMLLA